MKNILISGASFAGLCTAYWMNKLGYKVTVVEIAPELKRGGTPVNIMENTIDVVKRMGLLEQIKDQRLHMEVMEFKNAADVTERSDNTRAEANEYEIERDVLLHLLYNTVKADVEFIFDDRITELDDQGDRVSVNFKTSGSRDFDLVFGCDGIHSVVRKFVFGEENKFAHFLGTYFSITIIDKLLINENTTQLYSEPGKTIMLNAYNGKTDIVMCFSAEQEISYDYRNEAQQRDIILEYFEGAGWRAAELLEEVKNSKTFYFDKLCQMKMPSWTKGRIALAGDAAYCASPAAGRGGSLAIDGAAALADAFQKYPESFELAFTDYNKSFRPFIEEVQADVINFGLDVLVPKTEEAIHRRNKEGFGF
jgi:2-polyprenyl-6-methoxyphenol hydroxylase-like FAD-dependent oxidoreductase